MHYIFPLILLGAPAVAVCVLTAESGRAIRRGDKKAKEFYGGDTDGKNQGGCPAGRLPAYAR